MLHTKLILTAFATVALAVPGFAGDTAQPANKLNTHLEQIVFKAKKAQLEAQELNTQLKSKRPDETQVQERVKFVEQHVGEVGQLVNDFSSIAESLDADQRAHYEQLRTSSQLLTVYLDHKKSMLEESGIAKKRAVLRVVTRNIASHAQRVQEAALRIRS